MIKELTTDQFYTTITDQFFTLVDFWSPTCAPCVQIKKILYRLDAPLKIVNLYTFDTTQEAAEDVTDVYGIRSVPTFILFRYGKEIHRLVGVRPLDEIFTAIERIIAG